MLFVTTTLIYLLILVVTVGHMLASRHEKRSGGRPAPGAGGQASRPA
jgi:hypothetical protein